MVDVPMRSILIFMLNILCFTNRILLLMDFILLVSKLPKFFESICLFVYLVFIALFFFFPVFILCSRGVENRVKFSERRCEIKTWRCTRFLFYDKYYCLNQGIISDSIQQRKS